MKRYFEYGKDVAGFVDDTLRYSPFAWPLTMTITPEKSGGYCVTTATDTSWDGTDEEQVAKFYSQTQVNT